MTNLRKAAEQAIEALTVVSSFVDAYYIPKGKEYLPVVEDTITALREALAKPDLLSPLFQCEVQARPLRYPLSDYHIALTDGPLNFTWKDKPHRLLYDLIAAVKYYAAKLDKPAVPKGFKPVPVVPTNEMTSAMADALEDPENERSRWDLAENMYAAMLLAAPQPKDTL